MWVRLANLQPFNVKFSVPKMIKIGSFLTELFKNKNVSLLGLALPMSIIKINKICTSAIRFVFNHHVLLRHNGSNTEQHNRMNTHIYTQIHLLKTLKSKKRVN